MAKATMRTPHLVHEASVRSPHPDVDRLRDSGEFFVHTLIALGLWRTVDNLVKYFTSYRHLSPVFSTKKGNCPQKKGSYPQFCG